MKANPVQKSRRRFLLGAIGAGAAMGGGALRYQSSGLQVFRGTCNALGSTVAMTAVHADRDLARAAVEAAFAELERVENVMSIYRGESQLCRLNREGMLADPDTSLVDVLVYAREIAARSEGAFDVTVQPLWRLHSAAHKEGRQPETDAVAAARACVDWRQVKISSGHIALEGEGTAVTLNGIAQGYAADAAMRVMHALGIQDALIDTGEMGAIGHNAKGEVWTIGVQHPRQENAFATVARLDNRCLATSGDYQTAFSADLSSHHVFDPRTGFSPGELASVSVLAASAMAADALSTAVLVMGAERGLALLQTFEGTDALLIRKDGSSLVSPGFPTAA